MKKCFAAFLSMAMLLSLFTAIPAQAYGSNPGYPFIWENYEDAEDIRYAPELTAPATREIVSNGANGSNGSLQVHLPNNFKNIYYDLRYSTDGLRPLGRRNLTVSTMLKLNSPLKSGNIDNRPANRVGLIFWINGTITDNGALADDHPVYGIGKTIEHWVQKNVDNQMVYGEWNEISTTFEWPASGSRAMTVDNTSYTLKYNDISVIRICVRVGDTNGYKISAAEDGSLDYQVDDFKVECANVTPTNIDSTGTYVINNKSGKTTNLETSAPSTWKNVDLSLGNVQVGRLYKITGTVQYDSATGEAFAGTKAKLRFYLANSSNRATQNPVDATFLGGVAYPDTFAHPNNPEFDAGKPYSFAYYYYIDDTTFTMPNGIGLALRIVSNAKSAGNSVYDSNVGAAGTYSFKNMYVQDLGTPGDASEPDLENIPIIYNAVNLYNNVNAFRSAIGWTSCERVTEENGNVYYRQTEKNAPLMPGSYTATFQNGKAYKISFRAKSEAMADGESNPLSLVFDRCTGECETMLNNAKYQFETPRYEYISNNWTLTNEWNTFTCFYAPNFPLKAGVTEATKDTLPIRPYVKFLIGEAGTNIGASISYDDFTITEVSTEAGSGCYATVENLRITGDAKVGGTLRAEYDYVPYCGESEDKNATLVRAYIANENGTETTLDTFPASESFTVPTYAWGKNIRFHVIPVSTTQGVGSSAVSAPVLIATSNILTLDGVNVTAYSTEATAKILFATYTNDELVDVEVVDAIFTDGKFTCTVPAELLAGESMKVMMWKNLVHAEPLCVSVDESK